MQATGPSQERVWSRLTRLSCAAILVIAAVFKAHQLFADAALGVVYGSRWIQTALVEYELFLASWLVCAFAPQWARRVALATFVAFGCYSLLLFIRGDASCGCFGKAGVNPALTLLLDGWLVCLLVAWKPPASSTPAHRARFSSRGLQAAAICAIISISVVTLPLVAAWHPVALSPSGVSTRDATFVVLEPEKWIGKPFPLYEDIEVANPGRLRDGSWALVFYHHDCPKCRKLVPIYQRLAEKYKSTGQGPDIALIEVRSSSQGEQARDELCISGRLSLTKEWIVKTPSEVRIRNGQVVAATFDEASFLCNAVSQND